MIAAVIFRKVTLPLDGFPQLEREATAEGHKFLAYAD